MKTNYEDVKSVYVHNIDCDGPECDGSCSGYFVRPSPEEFAATIAAEPDDMPIPGWDYTATELRQLLGIEIE